MSFYSVAEPRIAIHPDGAMGSRLGHVRRCLGLAARLKQAGATPLGVEYGRWCYSPSFGRARNAQHSL